MENSAPLLASRPACTRCVIGKSGPSYDDGTGSSDKGEILSINWVVKDWICPGLAGWLHSLLVLLKCRVSFHSN